MKKKMLIALPLATLAVVLAYGSPSNHRCGWRSILQLKINEIKGHAQTGPRCRCELQALRVRLLGDALARNTSAYPVIPATPPSIPVYSALIQPQTLKSWNAFRSENSYYLPLFQEGDSVDSQSRKELFLSIAADFQGWHYLVRSNGSIEKITRREAEKIMLRHNFSGIKEYQPE